jgi:hypothetical protein
MSFLPVSCRGLQRTVAACAVAATLCVGGLVPAHADERTVLAVVTCDSYADLKRQFGWLGAQVGQPGLPACSSRCSSWPHRAGAWPVSM